MRVSPPRTRRGAAQRGALLSLSLSLSLSLLLLLCLIACSEKPPSPPPPPPAAAEVDGEAIPLKAFEESLAREMALAVREGPLTEGQSEGLKEAVVENLIRESLMLRRAREIALEVGEAELAARIEEIRRDYQQERFNELFGPGRVDYDQWKEALRKRMLFEKLVTQDVNAKIQVTDDEAQRHYRANRKAYATERRVRVAQIVLPDRERAEAVLKRLKTGEDFDKVAREVSIGPEAVRGGDLGFIERDVMPEAIDRMVFSLAVGKVSRVVQSPYGFHIFKILGQEQAGGRKFEDVRERVIVDLKKQREDGAFKIWIEGLKAKAVIRVRRPLPSGPPPEIGEADLKSVPLPAPVVRGRH